MLKKPSLEQQILIISSILTSEQKAKKVGGPYSYANSEEFEKELAAKK